MAESLKPMRGVVTAALLLLTVVLILQALGYGIGFFFDPKSGVGEFASPPPAGDNELTVALIGLIGVGMLASAATLTLSAALVIKRRTAGPFLAMAVGFAYVLAGGSVLRVGWVWDASFYAGSGALLILLAVALRGLRTPAQRGEEAVQ